jgi:hypothetical protein
MKERRTIIASVVIVHLAVLVFLGSSMMGEAGRTNGWLNGQFSGKQAVVNHPTVGNTPSRVSPLYNDSTVVSDADLAMVLGKIRPRFSRKKLKPNFIEHALRTWGVQSKFNDQAVMSGEEMRDVLIDHGNYVKSWSTEIDPLLQDQTHGVSVRWGRAAGASVHHDHLLASLTEAGVSLDTRIYPPGGKSRTFNDLLQESFRDFRLDEREVEWSAMAYSLWFAPTVKSWKLSDGRRMSFDQIAQRLMRGHSRFGVCNGTHRVYSLTLLIRLNQQHHILSTEVTQKVMSHLRQVRDHLIASQFSDGHWPSNWSEGLKPNENSIDDADFKKVIATGHHLEWQAIAPQELQLDRKRICRAAKWLIHDVRTHDGSHILRRFTFYSHVGSALAAWRGTTPYGFWRNHLAKQASQ